MKRSYTNLFGRLLIIVITTIMIIGASSCSTPSGENSGQNSDTASVQNSQPATEITMWGEWSGEGETQVNTMVDKFNASQTSVSVKYLVVQDMVTKFLTASTSGQTPDIIIWDRFMTALYASKNVMTPIDDYIVRDSVKIDDFFPEAVRELSFGGKTFGLPLTVDGWNLFINKTLFAEKGLTAPTTWDELANCAKTLTIWEGDKLVRAGVSLAWNPWLFNQWIQTAGGQVVSDDGKTTMCNTDKGLLVLNFWDKLLNEDKVYKIGFEAGLGDGVDAFVTGKVAITWGGMWSVEGYRKYGKELDFELIPMPAGPNGDRGGFLGGFGLIIPSTAKNKDAAWEFMKWWTVDPVNALEWAKTSKNVPGNLSVTNDSFFTSDANYKNLVEAMKYAKIRPPFPGYSSLETQVIGPNLQRFMEGKTTAVDVLKKMQTQGDKLLASYQD